MSDFSNIIKNLLSIVIETVYINGIQLFEISSLILLLYLIFSGIFCIIFSINWINFLKSTILPIGTMIILLINSLYSILYILIKSFYMIIDAIKQIFGVFYFIISFFNYITYFVYSEEANLI